MMTVKELMGFCEEQVKKGNGDKVILVTDDEEANGYHPLFAQFEDSIEVLEEVDEYTPLGFDTDQVVLLG